MPFLMSTLLFVLSVFSETTENTQIFCNIAHQPQHSELRITMDSTSAVELALRSPNENNFRPMNMIIQDVIGDFSNDEHAFLAKPNVGSEMIDWTNEPFCYKEIGTQWYFNFNYEINSYYVQLMPFYVIKDSEEICITPRFPPQTKQLICYQ